MSKQLLSAAVDAAATEAEWDALIEAIEHDPELKGEWNRIWAMRDAQDGVALAARPDFCSGVMAAIANEQPLPSNVVPLKPRVAAPVKAPPRRASWRTLVPLSAAAGIAAAVLMVNGLRESPSNTTSQMSASSAATVQTTPVRYAMEPDAEKAAILNRYLMEHSNSLAERSMGGTLANARFAARTADYRPDSP